MKVYTFDLQIPAVLERECETFGWPRRDSAGDQMFDNTHFRTWDEAAARLVDEAEAALSLFSDDYEQAKINLQRQTERLAQYAALAVKAKALHRAGREAQEIRA